MATVLFALPVKSGQSDAVRAFCRECVGPRYADFDTSERRINVVAEHWYLQKTWSGEVFTFVVEGPDLDTTFASFIASKDPFDLWFKERVAALTGIDLNAGPPPADMIAETLADYQSATTAA